MGGNPLKIRDKAQLFRMYIQQCKERQQPSSLKVFVREHMEVTASPHRAPGGATDNKQSNTLSTMLEEPTVDLGALNNPTAADLDDVVQSILGSIKYLQRFHEPSFFILCLLSVFPAGLTGQDIDALWPFAKLEEMSLQWRQYLHVFLADHNEPVDTPSHAHVRQVSGSAADYWFMRQQRVSFGAALTDSTSAKFGTVSSSSVQLKTTGRRALVAEEKTVKAEDAGGDNTVVEIVAPSKRAGPQRYKSEQHFSILSNIRDIVLHRFAAHHLQ